jgi:hypothetical protein
MSFLPKAKTPKLVVTAIRFIASLAARKVVSIVAKSPKDLKFAFIGTRMIACGGLHLLNTKKMISFAI